jgi:hypothetical protein
MGLPGPPEDASGLDGCAQQIHPSLRAPPVSGSPRHVGSCVDLRDWFREASEGGSVDACSYPTIRPANLPPDRAREAITAI